jgi:hypothetical protein
MHLLGRALSDLDAPPEVRTRAAVVIDGRMDTFAGGPDPEDPPSRHSGACLLEPVPRWVESLTRAMGCRPHPD